MYFNAMAPRFFPALHSAGPATRLALLGLALAACVDRAAADDVYELPKVAAWCETVGRMDSVALGTSAAWL